MIFVEDIDFRISAKGFLGKHMLDGAFGFVQGHPQSIFSSEILLSWVCCSKEMFTLLK